MAYTKYSLTPANNTATPPDGAPEGMLPSAVNDTMRDMMAQIRDCGDGIRGGTYTMTAPVITGGTINGAAIGGTTAAAGKFTTLEATGVTTVQAGTVSAPAITTSGDTNTGIFFPAADTIAFAEGGAEAMRIDSSGNVGIGTSSPSSFNSAADNLVVGTTSGNNGITIAGGTTGFSSIYMADGTTGNETYRGYIEYRHSDDAMALGTAASERMRIDSAGLLLIGTNTSYSASYRVSLAPAPGTGGIIFQNANTNPHYPYTFANSSGTVVGYIESANTATTYVTSSDYRLKENIAPMTGALAKVAQLKPCTYTWKLDGSAGQGFIAHELQAVVPECVTGEKDAVNEDGSIKPQGVDTSFLVATLTAAIQEQQTMIEELKQEVAVLKAK